MTTEARRAYHREYMRALRAWWKEHKRCRECGKQDAYTLNGWSRCYECNEKHKAASTRYERKKGRKPIKRCESRKTKSEQLGIPRDEWFDHGLCSRCGSPLDGAMVTWDVHGRKSRFCSKCYQDAVAAAAKGREARRKKRGRYVMPPFANTPKAIANYQKLLKMSKQELEERKCAV